MCWEPFPRAVSWCFSMKRFLGQTYRLRRAPYGKGKEKTWRWGPLFPNPIITRVKTNPSCHKHWMTTICSRLLPNFENHLESRKQVREISAEPRCWSKSNITEAGFPWWQCAAPCMTFGGSAVKEVPPPPLLVCLPSWSKREQNRWVSSILTTFSPCVNLQGCVHSSPMGCTGTGACHVWQTHSLYCRILSVHREMLRPSIAFSTGAQCATREPTKCQWIWIV